MTEETTIWQGDGLLRCLERREETHDTASFILAAPPGQHFVFLPGQFISLGVTVEGALRWRAYSIASSPTQRERITIAVRRVAGFQLVARPCPARHGAVGTFAMRQLRVAAGGFAFLRSAVLRRMRHHADDVNGALVAGNPTGGECSFFPQRPQ